MDEPLKTPEPMDEFERELRQSLLRRPAPPNLKRRVLDARKRRTTERFHHRALVWQRLAACLVLAGALGGGVAWRHAEEQKKGEAAREQVMTALRITNRALNEMNARLAARNRADGE